MSLEWVYLNHVVLRAQLLAERGQAKAEPPRGERLFEAQRARVPRLCTTGKAFFPLWVCVELGSWTPKMVCSFWLP